MGSASSRLVIACLAALAGAAVLLTGCGSGWSDGGPVTRTLRGIVAMDDFVVAAGERVACVGDVTVQCQTATVAGEVFSRAVSAAGASGAGITVQAQGDIVVTGRIVAGDGVNGAAEGDGGDGGDVSLVSAAGGITVGTLPPQTTNVWAGHAGHGGGGIYGGGGGAGGTVALRCPQGTLTLHQTAGLLRMGDGGDGGGAVIENAATETYDAPAEPRNNGGDSGAVLLAYATLVGAEVRTVVLPEGGTAQCPVLGEGVALGGTGGDGGDVRFGAEAPATAAATRDVGTAELAAQPDMVQGGRGGNGMVRGGNGGNASQTIGARTSPAGGEGWGASAVGGRGGEGWWNMEGAAYHHEGDTYGGRGGDATAVTGRGAAGGPSQAGGDGGNAIASGGNGGRATSLEQAHAYPGAGGHARATGGRGGDGGSGCATRAPGGAGGHGGTAQAYGGLGWHTTDRWQGAAGGNATATSAPPPASPGSSGVSPARTAAA